MLKNLCLKIEQSLKFEMHVYFLNSKGMLCGAVVMLVHVTCFICVFCILFQFWFLFFCFIFELNLFEHFKAYFSVKTKLLKSL